MSFEHPAMLLLLAIPVLLLAITWQRRAPGVVLPFDGRAHARRRGLAFLLGCFESLPAIALAGALAMLAGPQVLARPTEERVLTNIQICFDVSGSMTAEDRYDMAARAVERFLDARDGDAFGFTLFGSEQIRWVPLTRDLEAVRQSLPFADPSRQPMHMGGTRIGAALEFCRANMLDEAEQGDRMIILVSDGFSSDLADESAASEIGDQLRRANITLYHVHVGSAQVPVEVADIARETGGEAFVATDRRGLERVFDHIDRMRPARFAPGGTVPVPWATPFAITMLIALGCHVIGLFGMRYTPW